MNNLTTASRKQIDTYDDSEYRCPQQIGEKNILLLRELSLIMENLSSNEWQEVICFSLSIFVHQQQ